MAGVPLVWDLLVKGNAPAEFMRVAASADKAATSAARASKGVATASDKMAVAGAKLSKGLTLPLLGIGVVAVDQAAKFQKSMTLIQTAGGESAKQTAEISKGIKKVATDTGTSLGQLSDGIYTVAKAGSSKWSATEQLTVLKAASQGAKAENVDLGTSVNALTSIMMSYHVPASQAVAVQNELIVGAGRAKTTMADYATSLSTVVPIASAAGISFDQVAGAIATLTQHGTTSAEATQELANTIRNLQAPSNVAVSAMNQMHISSLNVSKNLGKRGLTGTLEYIESKLPKTGLVYLDTMKHMESGTADLTAMTSKMPSSLAKLSKGFLDGSVTAKEYRLAFRDMGAAGYSQGSQFLQTAAKVKGFNDSLKAGTPAQKTMAAELKAIFGGATGLNTALQLGGENMAYFKDATKDVGDAAKHSGGDVLGWSKTQDTLAVKIDKAKASLQVMAVEIGTALIPVVTKIVGWVTRAVTSFEGLSSTWKHVIGSAALVLAALGPVLFIVGKLGVVFTALWRIGAGVVGFASKIIASFATVEAGTATMSATQATAAVEFAAAEAAKAAATAEAAVEIAAALEGTESVLAGEASAAAAEAIEFAAAQAAKAEAAQTAATAIAAAAVETEEASTMAFGPVGLAIGAVIGIGALAAHSLGLFGTAAHKAVGPEDDLTAAILNNNGALTGNVRALTAQKLQAKGAYDAGHKLHISTQTLTDATLGNVGAMKQVHDALHKATSGYDNAYAAMKGISDAQVKAGGSAIRTSTMQKAAYNSLTPAQKAAYDAAKKLSKAYDDQSAATKASAHAAHNEAEAMSLAGKNDTARAKALKQVAAQQAAVTKSLHGMNTLVATNGIILTGASAAAARNNVALGTMIGNSNNLAKSQLLAGGSLKSVTGGLDKNISAFRKQALAAGFSADSIDGLIKRYKLTPKAVITNMVANIGKATASAGQLQKVIDAINQHKVPGLTANSAQGRAVIAAIQDRIDKLNQSKPPVIDADTSPAMTKLQALLDAIPKGTFKYTVEQMNARSADHATGGYIAGPGTGTSDSIPANLSNGEFVVRASQTRKHLRLLHAINNGAKGFASGGLVSNSYSAIAAALSKLGATRAGIAGFLGNTRVESGGSTTAHNVGENAWGLQQWEGGRLTQLKALANHMGVSFKSQAAQVAMITQELTHGYKGTLNNLRHATNARKAAAYVDANYERSSGSTRGARESAAASFVKQLASGKLPGSNGLYQQTIGPITHTGSGKKEEWIFDGQRYASLRAAENAQDRARKKLAKSLGSLSVKIDTKDLTKFTKAVAGSAADLRSAFTDLMADVKKIGASPALIKSMNKIETSLLATQTKLAGARKTLTTLTDYKSGITNTLDSAYDGTKAGSITDMLSGLGGATATNNTYSAEVKKLTREAKGNKTLTAYIAKLAASGQTASLSTLASASPAELAQVTKAVGAYNTSIDSGGNAAVAERFNGQSVKTATANVNKLLNHEKQLTKAMGQLAHAAAHGSSTVHLDLGNGAKLSGHVVNSKEMQRLFAELEHELNKGSH